MLSVAGTVYSSYIYPLSFPTYIYSSCYSPLSLSLYLPLAFTPSTRIKTQTFAIINGVFLTWKASKSVHYRWKCLFINITVVWYLLRLLQLKYKRTRMTDIFRQMSQSNWAIVGTWLHQIWCSRSRRRAEKVDKRMVLVHTHGLFIT